MGIAAMRIYGTMHERPVGQLAQEEVCCCWCPTRATGTRGGQQIVRTRGDLPGLHVRYTFANRVGS